MLKYTAKLVNYAFDNSYTNMRLFRNKSERDEYFENLEGFTYPNNINFTARDILSTEINLRVAENVPLFNLLNYNYCVIKSEQETLYFFVKSSSQNVGGEINIKLENDIMQNYFYDADFSDCMIQRAHLNRWKNTELPNWYQFDCSEDSQLFEREDIKDLSKYLVWREKMLMEIDTSEDHMGKSKFNQWLYKNVVCWVYISISDGEYRTKGDANETGLYKKKHFKYLQATNLAEYSDSVKYGHACLCYPILKNGSDFYIKNTDNKLYSVDFASFQNFADQNDGLANVYSIKLSIKPPFKVRNYVEFIDYEIEEEEAHDAETGETIILQHMKLYAKSDAMSSTGTTYIDDTIDGACFSGMASINPPDPPIIPNEKRMLIYKKLDSQKGLRLNVVLPTFDRTLNFAWSKPEIVGADRNFALNPKMLSQDFKTLRICVGGNYTEFDMQKIGQDELFFEYFEPLSADVTKGFVRLKRTKSGVYSNEYYDKSYNGFSFTNDFSLPLAKGQDDIYFANNKNAYLSFQNQQSQKTELAAIRAAGSIVGGGISGMATGTMIAGIGGAFAGIVGGLSRIINEQHEKAQFDMTIDNMKSAPEIMQNMNGSAILINGISNMAVYIEIYAAVRHEQDIANNIQYEHGYIFNQFGNIKNYIYTRKFFNYIQAIPDNIKLKISNEAKSIMRKILANGIRLWHTDNIEYTKENYETWLEE